jgi:hypothetical protein
LPDSTGHPGFPFVHFVPFVAASGSCRWCNGFGLFVFNVKNIEL